MGKSLRVKVADEFTKEITKTLDKDPKVGGVALSLAVRLYCIDGLKEMASNEKDWSKVVDLIMARMSKWVAKLPEEKREILRESIRENVSDEDIEKLESDFEEEA